MKKTDNKRKKQVRFSFTYILIALLLVWLFQVYILRPAVVQQQEVDYSQFRSDLAAGNIQDVTIDPDRVYYTLKPTGNEKTGKSYNAIRPDPADTDLIKTLLDANVSFKAERPSNGLLSTLLNWGIILIPLAFIWYFMFRRMGQGGSQIMSIGKSNAHELAGEKTGVKFSDVGGADEVEVELKEVIEFLKKPDRFTKMGAKLPKGVLLVGPPGTGKTLLAKATAGEADVPFFSMSGSDFVEMFVGVGAARVRDLFEQAKAKAPVIVFIDEIDAIGQSRSTVGALTTNDEREQTLNQLLSEMDGFEPNQGVVIMAATNRPEILDAALLRPGRFDRQIQVTLPTEMGRRQILKIHTRNVPLGDEGELDRLAQITPGFSGADLANIVNEAALLAVRRNGEKVTMEDFDLAIERVIAGLQRRTPLKDEVKRKVAYHEGGHALVAQLLPHTEPVHRVSIIPTSKGALGYTMQMPEEDQYLLTEEELKERLAVMLGGRAAELLIFNEPSTGAANDLEKATEIARRMVTEFGMTDTLGPVRYASNSGNGYLALQMTLRSEISPETEALIDRETRNFIDNAQKQAMELLRTHTEALHEIARVLQQEEVITGDEIKRIADTSGVKEAS